MNLFQQLMASGSTGIVGDPVPRIVEVACPTGRGPALNHHLAGPNVQMGQLGNQNTATISRAMVCFYLGNIKPILLRYNVKMFSRA